MARQDTTEKVAEALRNWVGLQRVARLRVAVDMASVAAEATGLVAVAVTGAVLGDYVLWGYETADLLNVNAGIHVTVTDADEVSVNLSNNTVAAGAAIDLASDIFNFLVLRAMET